MIEHFSTSKPHDHLSVIKESILTLALLTLVVLISIKHRSEQKLS